MRELDAIIHAWRDLGAATEEAVLATVVHVEGSAYRRPGARMLISPRTPRIGSISGGCLEGEVVQRASWYTQGGSPSLRVYDTSSEDDAGWEFGLGCNGIVHLLLERVASPETQELLEFLDERRRYKGFSIVATVIRSRDCSLPVGARLLVDANGKARGNLAATALRHRLAPQISAVCEQQRSRLLHLNNADLFIEWIGEPQSLVVVGAGQDASPLVTIAAELGWHITVADTRERQARCERFPAADRVVVIKTEDPLRDLDIRPDSAVVLMTHSFPLDLRLVPRILELGPRYVGILGPRSRAERLFQELQIPEGDTVHAPAGMDIGCNTPAAIALSIIAEIQAVISGRMGGMLRNREGAIHLPEVEVGVKEILNREAVRPSYCETSLSNAG